MPIVVLSVDACTLAVKQINTKEDVIKYFEIGFNPDPQIETGMRVQVFDFTVCSKNIRFTRRLIEYFLGYAVESKACTIIVFLSGD